MYGTIRRLKRDHGYGFITPGDCQPDPATDVFFHFTSLQGVDFKELAEGEMVGYVAEWTGKGYRATTVARPAGEEGEGDPYA